VDNQPSAVVLPKMLFDCLLAEIVKAIVKANVILSSPFAFFHVLNYNRKQKETLPSGGFHQKNE
jgi:hypothetical protein